MKKHRGANTPWKNAERAVARRLDGVRSPNTGLATADVLNDRLAVEVKQRQTLPAWLLDAVMQAKRNAPATHLPVVVLHQAATKNYLALMPLEVLEHLLQEAQPPTLG